MRQLAALFWSAVEIQDGGDGGWMALIIGQCKMQTADCRLQTADWRLQTGGKMQTEGKMQTADCRPGVKCRLRIK